MVDRDKNIFRMYRNNGSVSDDVDSHRQRDRSMGHILVFSVCGCGGGFDLCVRRERFHRITATTAGKDRV